ncbi:nuclease-related domain-containing protein [Bacillus sp. THAF10]|uniref:nuclease-related domain-containing protein n=1 Tax=Bacillus sp. THAF10 TaxID=2587848 RepID=UPI0012690A3C|nr:nuclease-related domain-containing protein [Bacillus sp. THAF10]
MKRRVHPQHPKYEDILTELGIKEAGIYGEQALDYYLKLLPDTFPYFIFHDLRLPYKDTHFQMDTLILFTNFYLILEVKNLRGTIFFDPKNHQLIQEVEDHPAKVYLDPILQVSNQAYKLMEWFKNKSLTKLPGEKLVVLTHPKVLVKVLSSSYLIEKHVIKSPALNQKLLPFFKKHPTTLLDKKLHNKVSRMLLKDHTPISSSPIEQYDVLKADLLTGVLCPNCSPVKTTVMKRIRGKWQCPHCYLISKDAHSEALKDYALLISHEITMNELKWFLRLEDRHTIRRLLKDLNITGSGHTKSHIYNLTSLLPQ